MDPHGTDQANTPGEGRGVTQLLASSRQGGAAVTSNFSICLLDHPGTVRGPGQLWAQEGSRFMDGGALVLPKEVGRAVALCLL